MSRCGARFGRWLAMPALAAVAVASVPLAAQAADSDGLPEIRTGSMNRVPACVTPDRLMAFIAARNTKLPPKFANIAWAYRELGDSARIRWDYAFFQMILETNYLMYRRGDGSSGDVGQAQNNFAGIGATGGGVPGDKYGDVRTGVLAHMQHLLAYSGEKVERPVATRTRDYQNDIIEISRKLKRQVTFGDLSRRWAVDRAYGRNIETVATLYRRMYCTTTAAVGVPQASGPSALPWSVPQPVRANPRATFAPPSRLGGSPRVSEGREAAAPAATALVSTIWQRGEPETPETPPQTHVAPAVTAVPPVPSAPTAAVAMNDPAIIAVAPQRGPAARCSAVRVGGGGGRCCGWIGAAGQLPGVFGKLWWQRKRAYQVTPRH